MVDFHRLCLLVGSSSDTIRLESLQCVVVSHSKVGGNDALVLVQCEHWCIALVKVLAKLWCEKHLVAFTHIVPPGQGGQSIMVGKVQVHNIDSGGRAHGLCSRQGGRAAKKMRAQCQPTDLVPAPSSPAPPHPPQSPPPPTPNEPPPRRLHQKKEWRSMGVEGGGEC